MALYIAPVIAFFLSGRASVTTRTPSDNSVFTPSVMDLVLSYADQAQSKAPTAVFRLSRILRLFMSSIWALGTSRSARISSLCSPWNAGHPGGGNVERLNIQGFP